MRPWEDAPALQRGRCRLTHLACRVLEKRFPNSSNPIEDWLPHEPDWSRELPDIDILRRELAALESRGGKIVLYGHDDMDGITGIYTGKRILEGEGFEVVPLMPRKVTDDYGLLPKRMEGILLPGDLLLTVDYGCSAVRGVEWAVDLGARVVITDNHTQNKTQPPESSLICDNLR